MPVQLSASLLNISFANTGSTGVLIKKLEYIKLSLHDWWGVNFKEGQLIRLSCPSLNISAQNIRLLIDLINA